MRQLTEEVVAMPEGACPDLLILPLYAAMPLEMQVCELTPLSLLSMPQRQLPQHFCQTLEHSSKFS